MLTAAPPVFALALWLGLWLLGREPGPARLGWLGLGLLAYAAGLGLGALAEAGPPAWLAEWLPAVQRPLLYLPALLWSGGLLGLLPDEAEPATGRVITRGWRLGWWRWGLWPVAGLLYGLVVLIEALGLPGAGLVRGALALVCSGGLLATAVIVWRRRGARMRAQTRRAIGLVAAAAIMLALSAGLLLLGPTPGPFVVALAGIDLCLLGLALAACVAADQGERFLPDCLRAAALAVLAVVALGGPVAAAGLAVGEGHRFAMVALWLAVVTVALAALAFAGRIEVAVERAALAPFGALTREPAELRAVAAALPRLDPALDLTALDEAEFARLTRRVLSHLGDLPQLAVSPLTYLPIVSARLAARQAPGHALDRAAELRLLLVERIERLKPRAAGDFGPGDEWRHYNALYFPYVAGLKPYRRRWQPVSLDPASAQALDWFRREVPERTLYHWQTAATRLIAHDLRHAGADPEAHLAAVARR